MNFSAMFRAVKTESITIVIGIVLMFMLINFNKELGIIYSVMLLLDYIMIKELSGLNYPFEKDENRFEDLLYGMAGYAVFIILSTFIVGTLSSQAIFKSPLNAVFGKLAAATPILSDSKILTIIGWGVIIPIVETRFFFGRLMEFLKSKMNLPGHLSLLNMRTWVLFTFVSAVFALFHLTARAVTTTQFDNIALIMTFMFGIVSCVIIAITKELASATYTHVINNSIAVFQKLGFTFINAILGIPAGA